MFEMLEGEYIQFNNDDRVVMMKGKMTPLQLDIIHSRSDDDTDEDRETMKL